MYRTSADTVINGLTYHVLDGYHYIQGNFLIREAVGQRRVFMKVLADHVLLDEFPLYDFSLQEGDSVHVYNPISPLPVDGGLFILDSIRSRPLESGDHRFFYLHAIDPQQSLSEHTIWVEGVGSLSLINTPGAPPAPSDHLVCMFKDGVLQYADLDSVDSCSPMSIGQMQEQTGIGLFPNPAECRVRLTLSTNEVPRWLTVMGAEGKSWYDGPWVAALSVQRFPSGLYVLVAQWNDGEHAAVRFLVKH